MRASLVLALAFGACGLLFYASQAEASDTRAKKRREFRTFRSGADLNLVLRAEAKASPGAARILGEGRGMALGREILPGACWDYINTAWIRAGYPKSRREVVFRSRKGGPYAAATDIKPGDWLYFINHSYRGVEHSALFVDWADRGRRSGYLLSYAGEKRAEPARYLAYDLRSVYQVTRARE